MNNQCHLCRKAIPLVDSHVWPALAYKRFAIDTNKGGQFLDLEKKDILHNQIKGIHNKQVTFKWFCKKCEDVLQKTEDATARILDRIKKAPSAIIQYDDRFHKFATSISWRTLKYHRDPCNLHISNNIYEADRLWRQYLNVKRNDVGAFTQHVFVVFDQRFNLHKALGGSIPENDSFVFSQIGPLFIVGLVGVRSLSKSDRLIWRRSELDLLGGIITPLQAWQIGRNVTGQFFQFLNHLEYETIQRVHAWHQGENIRL